MERHYLLQVVIVVFVRRSYIFHLYFTALLHVTDRWKSPSFVRQFPGVWMNNHCRFLWSISIGKLFNISIGTFSFMEKMILAHVQRDFYAQIATENTRRSPFPVALKKPITLLSSHYRYYERWLLDVTMPPSPRCSYHGLHQWWCFSGARSTTCNAVQPQTCMHEHPCL